MTVAGQHAMLLRRYLRRSGPVRHLQRAIARASAVAWTMSAHSDLRMPWIEGARTPLVRLGNAYAARLYRAARDDAAVARSFMRVASLVDPPLDIVRPTIALRVLFRGGQTRHAKPPAGDAPPVPAGDATPVPASDDEREHTSSQ
jgi:hypothetical protein